MTILSKAGAATVALCAAAAFFWSDFDGGTNSLGISLIPTAAAQGENFENTNQEVSPINVSGRERDTYHPNTEDLAPDEMRVIACGTGMPTTRAAQAAACFLVELGNGDPAGPAMSTSADTRWM